MAAKRRVEERVRSIAEIRGRYGLADEEFRVLAEGDPDRTKGTVVGRERRATARKLVATEQAVMGTARLDQPESVRARAEPPPEIPMTSVRWAPLVAGALVTPVILAIIYLSGDDPARPATPASSASVTHVEQDRNGNVLPDRPSDAVHSKHRGSSAATDSKPAVRRAPVKNDAGGDAAESASAVPARRNALPDFPDLEDP
jgi:hypothetical protein